MTDSGKGVRTRSSADPGVMRNCGRVPAQRRSSFGCSHPGAVVNCTSSHAIAFQARCRASSESGQQAHNGRARAAHDVEVLRITRHAGRHGERLHDHVLEAGFTISPGLRRLSSRSRWRRPINGQAGTQARDAAEHQGREAFARRTSPRRCSTPSRASRHTDEAWRVDQANQRHHWLYGCCRMRPGRCLPYPRNVQTLTVMAKHKTQANRDDRSMRGHGLACGRTAHAWVRADDACLPRETRAACCAGVRG